MSDKNHVSDKNHKGGIGFYVLVALILCALTYLEFAIVEYNVSWLNVGATYALLAIMSLVKFFMVIWFFMHLKDDNKTYTGFFSSGMVIAMGTFIALAALFTVRSAVNARAQQVEVVAHSEAGAGHEEVMIAERPFEDTLRVPQPKNQGLAVELPKAVTTTFSLNGIPAFGLSPEGGATPTPEPTLEPASEPASEAAPSTETAASTSEPATNTAEASSETTSDTTTTSETATASATATAAETPLAADVATWDEALGEQTYTNCLACHQPTGKGVPAAFPPLAGHINELYNIEGGREYIINTVLYGLQGEIEVAGSKYNGVMTPWGPLLKDEQIAAVLNHELTSWGNDALVTDFTPITPEEVAALRANNLTSQQVYELRGTLGLE